MTESVTQTRPDDRNDRTPRAIEASGISKSFGGVRALHDAGFAAEFGEVHALVGENGAGKSTMIKILSGVLKPDEGVVRVRGDEVDLSRPHDAQALGVATVFQELTLLPWMTVAENLLIGKEPRGPLPLIRRRALPEGPPRFSPGSAWSGSTLSSSSRRSRSPNARCSRSCERSCSSRRSCSSTSQLRLSRAARSIGSSATCAHSRERGACVIFTSHRWGEVVDLADRITVFRNGEHVTTRTSIEEGEAVTLMTGRTIDRIYPDLPAVPEDAPVVLEVRDLASPGVNGFSLELRRGRSSVSAVWRARASESSS